MMLILLQNLRKSGRFDEIGFLIFKLLPTQSFIFSRLKHELRTVVIRCVLKRALKDYDSPKQFDVNKKYTHSAKML